MQVRQYTLEQTLITWVLNVNINADNNILNTVINLRITAEYRGYISMNVQFKSRLKSKES